MVNISKVSAVIPIYNEELAIAGNVDALVQALKTLGREWELVLVNDGSTDKTLSIIEVAAKKETSIKIVSYSKNRGRGFALKSGFKTATGDYVITTESDLNWGVDIINRFVNELDKGDADIIIASPHLKGGGMQNVPFLRWALSYVGNKIFSLSFSRRFTMTTGMTRAYRREVLDALDLESDDKELHIEILYKALDLGFVVREIPAMLRWKKAKDGEVVRKSHFKFRSIGRHLLLSFDVKPYLLFGAIGIFFIAAGAIAGVYLLMLSFSGTAVAGRPLLFFAVLCIVVGFQMLLFGFLATQNRDTKRQLIRLHRTLKELNKK